MIAKCVAWIERDRADDKRRRWNIAALIGRAAGQFRSRFPTDRPEWIPAVGIHFKSRFILHLDLDRLVGSERRARP